jgi:3-oxoacyl-[acyl-carrier protein] reductase
MIDLTRGVALVIGSRGIGRAVAISLAEAGAAVAVNYREKSVEAEAVAKAIRDKGGMSFL